MNKQRSSWFACVNEFKSICKTALVSGSKLWLGRIGDFTLLSVLVDSLFLLVWDDLGKLWELEPCWNSCKTMWEVWIVVATLIWTKLTRLWQVLHLVFLKGRCKCAVLFGDFIRLILLALHSIGILDVSMCRRPPWMQEHHLRVASRRVLGSNLWPHSSTTRSPMSMGIIFV